ncbi:MAG: hypothetical protein COB88_05940 [Flavobacteriales bacterium]|nr:MAG: hypothetical protein COB88_05940 [Flavobacteriales bacterium]
MLMVVFIALLFTSSSCKKKKEREKWKLPTDVSFKMDINRTVTSGGNLAFTGGTIILGSFTFDGKRSQADDVFFVNNYSGLSINFDPNSPVAALDFDIPQGTYSKISVSFQTYGNAGDDHIVVTGTYKNSVTDSIYPLRFEFEAMEFYTVISKDASGSSEIILDESVASTATITLDPVFWFQTISTSALDNATLVNVNGVPTILITDAKNEDIFDLVIDRVDDATEVVFD